jgi:hypothetical protein
MKNRISLALLASVVLLLVYSCEENQAEPSVPKLIDFSPTYGLPGDTITIKGENFGNDISKYQVILGTNTVELIEIDDSYLKVIVPELASTGKLTISFDGKNLTSEQDFIRYNVYVSGEEFGSNKTVLKYWKNAASVTLESYIGFGKANSIEIIGNDVFLAGDILRSTSGLRRQAIYWRNNVGFPLTDGAQTAKSIDIKVNGNDIYAAGYETSNGGFRAKLWKNGEAKALSSESSIAYSIAISGNDIYVAGFEGVSAKYWKNGVGVNLTTSLVDSRAFSVKVVGADVYLAGYDGKVAKYWKNGSGISLTDGSNSANATDIFIVDKDVYVSGWEYINGTYIAKYWKNGKGISLNSSNETSMAFSIIVFNKNIYCTGDLVIGSKSVGGYWRNGKFIQITEPNSDGSLHDIAIAP